MAVWDTVRGTLTQGPFCALLGISRTTLWRWRHAPAASGVPAPSAPRGAAPAWEAAAHRLCRDRRFRTYGYRRIAWLLQQQGAVVGVHAVRRWMRAQGYAQCGSVRDTGRTAGEKPAAPTGPNQAWQLDATKHYTVQDGWVWQTNVLDLFDRRVVAHVVRKTCRTEDTLDAVTLALDAAYGAQRPTGLAVIHDRGSQFTAWSFKDFLAALGITDVVTAVRHPQSCGCLERWHRTLKAECVWQEEWATLGELAQAVAAYIAFYNRERIHSALGYRTPWDVYQAAVGVTPSLKPAA